MEVRGAERKRKPKTVTYYSCTHGGEDVMCRMGSVQSVMDGCSILQFAVPGSHLRMFHACHFALYFLLFIFPTQMAELGRKTPVRDTVRYKVKSGLFKQIEEMFIYGQSVP